MKTPLRLSLSLLALGLPLLALAAPASVSGIKASLQPDGVQVQWDKVEGDVAAYKIYYSHESILSNGGLFDDFETAAGTAASHILRNVPPSNDLYVSVLAVNAAGEESPYFTEEAHVSMTNGPSPMSAPAMTMPASAAPSQTASSAMTTASSSPLIVSSKASSMTAPVEDILRLLSVEAVSATGVVLHFSHTVTIDPAHATEAVEITTASGTKLAMTRLVIQGKDIHVNTQTQERGTAYKVIVGMAVSTTGGAGQKLTVSPDEAPVLFSGHVTGRMPSSTAAVSSAATSDAVRTEVQQLRLRAQPTGTTYRVETTWQPAGGSVTGYAVSQTTDGGKTFGASKTIKPEERDLIVAGVPAGSFGVRIKTVYSDGSMSKGIVQTIELPRLGTASKPAKTGGVTGSVTGGSKALPNSGPALWLAIAATGAAAGWMQTRRKKEAVPVA